MDLENIRVESVLYSAAIVIGVFVRFYNLGAAPLSESEAEWAMQALLIAKPALQDSTFQIGPQPGYIFLTSLLFSLFGSSEFLARFWPALSGSAVILVPFLFRRLLGPVAALVMAFGLALDPGLTAVSRQAGGPMMALAFTLLAIALWLFSRAKSSGIFTGLASMSGPAVITGWISLGISNFLAGRISVFTPQRQGLLSNPDLSDNFGTTDGFNQPQEGVNSSENTRNRMTNLRWQLLFASAVVLILGTYFFQYLQGLVAWFETIPAYLSGWINPSGIPARDLVSALLVFEPLVLVFGFIGIIRWISHPSHRPAHYARFNFTLVFWISAALVILLVYPGRYTSDLVWVIVPLWATAAKELERYIPSGKPHPVMIVFSIVIFVLFALLWNSFIAPSQNLTFSGQFQISVRLALILGIFIMALLTIILVSLGWSWNTAKYGLVWGAGSALLIYTLSVSWGAAQLRQNQTGELWYPPPGTGQVSLLLETVREISNNTVGFPEQTEIISTIQTPAMRWVLRDFPNARFVSVLPSEDLPPLIITGLVENISVRGVEHRGQDFVWHTTANWQDILANGLIPWFTFRKYPSIEEMVILWVRSDLFPGDIKPPEPEIIEVLE